MRETTLAAKSVEKQMFSLANFHSKLNVLRLSIFDQSEGVRFHFFPFQTEINSSIEENSTTDCAIKINSIFVTV